MPPELRELKRAREPVEEVTVTPQPSTKKKKTHKLDKTFKAPVQPTKSPLPEWQHLPNVPGARIECTLPGLLCC